MHTHTHTRSWPTVTCMCWQMLLGLKPTDTVCVCVCDPRRRVCVYSLFAELWHHIRVTIFYMGDQFSHRHLLCPTDSQFVWVCACIRLPSWERSLSICLCVGSKIVNLHCQKLVLASPRSLKSVCVCVCVCAAEKRCVLEDHVQLVEWISVLYLR